jgi:hypothetical protein
MKQPNLAVPINMASSDTRQEKPEEFCMTKADCCLSLSGVLKTQVTVSHAEDGSPNTEHILLSCLLCPDLPFPETRFSATSPKPALCQLLLEMTSCLATDACQNVPSACVCYARRMQCLAKGNKSNYAKQKPKPEEW